MLRLSPAAYKVPRTVGSDGAHASSALGSSRHQLSTSMGLSLQASIRLGGGAFSQRYLKLRFPLQSFAAYAIAGGAMYLVVRALPALSNDALTLGLRIPVGALAYVAVAVALDAEARKILRQGLDKVLRRKR